VRADWEHYERDVKPLLDGGGVELVGEVGDEDKSAFLGGALALLNPIDWPEPFGLVMAEALACGTPVVARRRGSVPEVIADGVTGLIGETDDELGALCVRVHEIDRRACREEALRRFSPRAMVDGYEAIYGAMTQGDERPIQDAGSVASLRPRDAINDLKLTGRRSV
jgi:glycosyltransferase involved in cell wall biosynthesis